MRVRAPIDFDAWRRKYDQLTYSEHVEFYSTVAEVYPDQQHYNEPAVREFLRDVSAAVLEIGGWKGELAAAVLPDFPSISSWLNIEIAPQAVTDNVCSDARYAVEIPPDFIWNTGIDLSGFQTLIASHVIEHMKVAQAEALLSRLPALTRLYVDAPLPAAPSAWDGGESSHIIEVGWDGLADLIIGVFGFERIGEMPGKWGPAYWFARGAT